MDVHPPKNGIFIGIDPYPFGSARNGAQYSAAFGEDALHRFVLVPHKVTHLQNVAEEGCLRSSSLQQYCDKLVPSVYLT